jgi:type VI secretion system protein ImpJ
MKSLSRVVWSEGMHLGPHHFQAQSHYFEDSIRFAVDSLWPNAWGVAGCEIDSAALKNGTISVVHARGVFRDGLAFNMPESDPLPQPRSVIDLFPPTRDTVTVSLAVPARKADAQNTSLAEGDVNGYRYSAETRRLTDETTGRDEKSVRLGRKNIRLLLDTEEPEDQVCLNVARIMRSGSGQFQLDPSFIPPCLRITASERLLFLLRRLIEIMQDKSASLEARNSAGRQAFSTRELATYWFTHCVNSSLLPLRHLCFAKHSHPEEVWLELCRLAGALFTFALESHPRSLPLYDHTALDECFTAMDQVIRMHLDLVVPTNAIRIPLARTSQFFWSGELRDKRVFDRSDWLLSLNSGQNMAETIERAGRLIKVCSREFVPKLVERALPGMVLSHLPAPPPAVAPSVERQYFNIAKGGPCWDNIRKSGEVGIYVPEDLPEPDPEIIVVLHSE